MTVADELNLDMARLLDKFLDEHTVIAKTVACLVAAAREALKRLLVIEGHAQALAAAAGTGLDHDRITDALGDFDRKLSRFNCIIDTGDAVHARRTRELFGLNLVAHRGNGVMLGADEDNALFFHAFGKPGVFAQETVAGVHRLRAGLLAGRDDLVGQQITFPTRCRADVDGLVSEHHMERVLVSVGIDRDGLDAHFLGGLDNPASDLTTVGNQYFGKHGFPNFIKSARLEFGTKLSLRA